MSRLKRPLTKNFYLSLTGKEPVLNNFSLYNNFPMGLMIISKMDPTSCRDKDNQAVEENDSEDEVEIKIKYLNQQASDLFEIKENDDSSKIHEQLKQFKRFDKTQITEETLDLILFNKNRENEFYGSFKSQASLIYVKFKANNEDLYICTDYYTDERKIMQDQLFQGLKFQYIATLFHELYNPINALLIMIDMDQNEEKEELNKSNLGNKNNSENEESHYSVVTENENEKVSSKIQENENDSSSKKNKIEKEYKNKLCSMHEKEKDMSLLVNMIYIFLQNLILYLRINLESNIENEKDINHNENNNNEKDNLSKIIKDININNNMKEEEKNNENYISK